MCCVLCVLGCWRWQQWHELCQRARLRDNPSMEGMGGVGHVQGGRVEDNAPKLRVVPPQVGYEFGGGLAVSTKPLGQRVAAAGVCVVCKLCNRGFGAGWLCSSL